MATEEHAAPASGKDAKDQGQRSRVLSRHFRKHLDIYDRQVRARGCAPPPPVAQRALAPCGRAPGADAGVDIFLALSLSLSLSLPLDHRARTAR
jgi:hypothetical protein